LRLYSVTEPLSKYADFSRVPDDLLQLASDRGVAVHRYCQAYALGAWTIEPEGYEGYCESFRRWFDTYVVEVISVEQEYQDEQFGFIGHPDILAVLKGMGKYDGRDVIDYKSPKVKGSTWELQLAAYKHLTKADKAGSLRLDPNGGVPKMDWIPDDPKLFNLFLMSLNLHRYFNK
jgi:hypothetical protein